MYIFLEVKYANVHILVKERKMDFKKYHNHAYGTIKTTIE
jgi:hypothetical protein